ncbi:hypothetical protein CFOL_v3_29165 [Cephalotus follicularis]|uniref:UBN2_3 domain-containing protein n=1 Tax=Cephalotus follicularis TaxID=3775 RepID=A0A1Q3D018_CEPFO|nr:hypothetical protein CFOL_v3_29165 [Cephalotus follicularis]
MSWRKIDLVKAWITSTLSVEVLDLAVGIETTQDLWSLINSTIAIDKPVPDQRKVFLLLTSLWPAYKAFAITTPIKLPVSSCTKIIPMLQSH